MTQVDDLIASLDAEFGKPSKKKGQSPAAAGRTGKKPAVGEAKYWEIMERKNAGKSISMSEWRFLREFDRVDALSKATFVNKLSLHNTEEFTSTYQPVAREMLSVVQTCTCCNRTVEFISGCFIRFQSKRKYASIIKQRADQWSDYWHLGKEVLGRIEELPIELETIAQEVPQCARCVRAGKFTEELWATAVRVVAKEPDTQLEINLDLEGFEP